MDTDSWRCRILPGPEIDRSDLQRDGNPFLFYWAGGFRITGARPEVSAEVFAKVKTALSGRGAKITVWNEDFKRPFSVQ